MIEPVLGAVVDFRYDFALVALSFVIAVLGSYVALMLASAPDKGQGRVFGPAVALGGCGIWSMHFIGMMAYKTPLNVWYAILPTLMSLVIVILVTAVGFSIALKGPEKFSNLALGGLAIGGGVATMHYMGMFGMTMRAEFEWNWPIVAGSVAIAVVAATVALWLAFNVKTGSQRMAAAIAMGIAVCAMHYTGMAAVTMICISAVPTGSFVVGGRYLAVMVAAFAVLLLGFSIAYSSISFSSSEPTSN